MTAELAPASVHLVPASYAEKTMASLMQLHTELMDEKERRVELFRALMEKEQALAELRHYVQVLEARAGVRQPEAAPASPPADPPVPSAPSATVASPPPRPFVDGWRAW